MNAVYMILIKLFWSFCLFPQIDLLFFTILYLSSYVVICHYKRQADKEDYFSGEVIGHFPINLTLTQVCANSVVQKLSKRGKSEQSAFQNVDLFFFSNCRVIVR